MRGTKSLEKTCFSAPRITPSLHFTPTIVLHELVSTRLFRLPWMHTRVVGYVLPECRWCNLGRTDSFKRFLNYPKVNRYLILSKPLSNHKKITSFPMSWICVHFFQFLNQRSSAISRPCWSKWLEGPSWPRLSSFAFHFLTIAIMLLKYLFESDLPAHTRLQHPQFLMWLLHHPSNIIVSTKHSGPFGLVGGLQGQF